MRGEASLSFSPHRVQTTSGCHDFIGCLHSLASFSSAFAGILQVNEVSWDCNLSLPAQEALVADDKCADNTPVSPAPQPAAQGGRMVQCVKFGRQLPGLDRVPWKGEIGKRVYENVSKDAWKMWLEHSKMVMNEYRLNPLDPSSQKIMEEQMEQFFFGEGAKLPEGYVPQHSKG
jgi:Fe-S cluster biosynthesis and repair protein YggX